MISRLILKIWRNVIWEALGRSRELAILAGASMIAGALALEFMIIEIASPIVSGIHSNLGGQGQIDLERLTFDEVALAAALILTLLSGLAPNLSALDRILASMPIRPSERYVGYAVPSLVLELAALVLLFAPIAFVVSTAPPGPAWVAAGFGLQILLAVLFTNLAQLFVTVTLVRVFALSEVLARMLGAACVGFAILTIMLSDVTGTMRSFKTPISALSLASAAIDPSASASTRFAVVAGAVAAAVAMAALILVLATLLVRNEGVSLRPMFPSLVEGRRGFSQLVVTSARLASRHPENRVTALLYFGMALMLGAFLASQRNAEQWSGIAILLGVAAAASLGLNAYGRTRPFRWIVVVAPLPRGTWLAANAMGALVVSVVAAAVIVLPFVLAGVPAAGAGTLTIAALAIFVLTYAWMHGIGVVVPYSEEIPLSSALVSLGALVLGLPLFYLLTKLGLVEGGARSVLLVAGVVVASAITASWVDRARLSATGP